MMPQFFVDADIAGNAEIAVEGADAAHITKVLRLRPGDWIVLSDGAGRSFRAVLQTTTRQRVTARIHQELPRRNGPPPPVLAHAVIKHDRTELIIQKAVELGIRELMPFRSARTIPRLADPVGARKQKRWQHIAHEAAKQSGLPFRPQVHDIRTFTDILHRAGGFDTALFFWEGETSRGLRTLRRRLQASGRTLIIIGPEGGFTDDEVEAAGACGAQAVSLGPQILRVETACIAAASICLYERGSFEPAGEVPP